MNPSIIYNNMNSRKTNTNSTVQTFRLLGVLYALSTDHSL